LRQRLHIFVIFGKGVGHKIIGINRSFF
jgi:hypothetical protein